MGIPKEVECGERDDYQRDHFCRKTLKEHFKDKSALYIHTSAQITRQDNPTTLLHLLGQSNGEPLSKKQVKLLLAATGWHKDNEFRTGTELVFDSDDQEWKVKDLLQPTGSAREPSPMNVDDNDLDLSGGILSPLPPPTSKASTSKASSSKASTSLLQEDETSTDSGDENGAGPSTRRKSRSAGTTPKRVEFKGSASASSSVPVTSKEIRAKNRPRSPVSSPSASKSTKKQGSKPKNRKWYVVSLTPTASYFS
ncbi:hypothetical protein K435DRAFT_860045 [Dendrothele bispora CBS 962.96]|uniref:Uncharacterized protein n=1 Tax=Dendrothele bispora (strain CBS 962.96) TaxID=1314807 RepID=A0A4S8LZ19_DENBC|nr:hypothetical protein K435DRAFT_860045 [Dendrothele bispora CBS 962.96]